MIKVSADETVYLCLGFFNKKTSINPMENFVCQRALLLPHSTYVELMCTICNILDDTIQLLCGSVAYFIGTLLVPLYCAIGVSPTCSSKARSATGPTFRSLTQIGEAFPYHNTCLSNYSTHSPGQRGRKRARKKERK